MSAPLRIGCVPYLNAKPLIDWFHEPDCDVDADVRYVVPSELARMLDRAELDVALVSTFELFLNPRLLVLPGISISADGPVRSVRLFSKVPFPEIRSVALDTSSLTSVNLIRVLLADCYGIDPAYESHPPDLAAMLAAHDAGLIIGDLKLFDLPSPHVMDLGAEWKALTGLPFCYAAWLAREDAPLAALADALTRAREWGEARLGALGHKWAGRLALPEDRVQDYFHNVMRYGLGDGEWQGLLEYQRRCAAHGLIPSAAPLRRYDPRAEESRA
jgi:chorismate dehydratase